MPMKAAAVVSATTAEKPKKRYPGEAKGFVEEMRFVAMKLHTREQAKEGRRRLRSQRSRLSPNGSLLLRGSNFILLDLGWLNVDMLATGSCGSPSLAFYAEFKNTGLERSEKLAKDLSGSKNKAMPFQSLLLLVSEKILNKKELEFYKWDGDLSQLLQNVRDKLNKVAEAAKSCPYTVTIKTSCSSSSYTRDKISLAFGDSYGNEVYVKRLDDPSSGTFERCSTDTFQINGPCAYDICYLYLLRSGSDGWKPESVKIYGRYTKTVNFYYNTFLPNGVWYGFNLCSGGGIQLGLPVVWFSSLRGLGPDHRDPGSDQF
ncbi:hypothetical protein GH714_041315 [Hevea brasiliensis]|uniref:PLAT domain-containing protein n=1 Tax=Hevea brasiliensis TaxID=3981 RepID=A0A6A6MWV9_HEVBR|nr:hypothetical protein GH714_041315 [Hevea brasiliensis]